MDRKVAEQLLELVMSLDATLNKAAELTEKISDVDERKAIRRGIGTVVSYAYTELIRPIARQFPDLDPEKKES